jgi:hypothetical protein
MTPQHVRAMASAAFSRPCGKGGAKLRASPLPAWKNFCHTPPKSDLNHC